MKASDIPDVQMLEIIATWNDSPPEGRGAWCLIWDVAERLPGFPEKVVLAKARQLIRRGLIDGCGCGCRGDFEITPVGREFLAALKPYNRRTTQ